MATVLQCWNPVIYIQKITLSFFSVLHDEMIYGVIHLKMCKIQNQLFAEVAVNIRKHHFLKKWYFLFFFFFEKIVVFWVRLDQYLVGFLIFVEISGMFSLLTDRWNTIILVYNDFHNILRLFDVLTKFPFTTSERTRDFYL